MRGDGLLVGLAGVLPPLAGHGHHADEHLGVHGSVFGAEAATVEFVGQDVFHSGGDVGEQGGECAFGLGRGSISHQDPETLGVVLDVGEQGQGGAFHEDTRLGFLGQCGRDRIQQDPELEVHHLRVHALFGTEVLVDHGLGDACAGRDFLDGGAVEAARGEQATADVDQLAAPLHACHPSPGWIVAHISIMPQRP